MHPFNPPFKSLRKKTYALSLDGVLKRYLTEVESLHSYNGDIQKSAIQNIIISINKSVELYLSGNSGEAYSELKTRLNNKEITNSIVNISKPNNDSFPLFKARFTDNQLSSRKNIFHLPFDQRHRVKNYRYSISGVPSLYLGSSSYICWVELGQPSFSKFWISRYEFDPKHQKVIDFTFSIEEKIEEFKAGVLNIYDMNDYLKVWPLIIACSFKTKHSNSDFNEEYIIPNIVLQWIKKNRSDIIGLKFLSTKSRIIDNKICTNYVFPSKPPRINESMIYCNELKDHFRLTNPVPWSILTTLPQPNYILSGVNSFKAHQYDEVIISLYESTQFRMSEKLLNNFNIRKIPIES